MQESPKKPDSGENTKRRCKLCQGFMFGVPTILGEQCINCHAIDDMYAPYALRNRYTSKLTHSETCMLVAHTVANARSKDPNTQVGAVVHHPKSGGMFPGYNGFPPGFPDLKIIWDDRAPASPNSKYLFVVHAETNAIRKAMAGLGDLSECELYCTHFPCHACMKDSIIMSGIRKVFYANTYPQNEISVRLARECKVELIHMENK